MKRFLIEIGISVVMIAIGTSLCFFELTGYDYVDQDEIGEIESVSVTVDEHHPLRLRLDDDLMIQYEYDDKLKNQVEIEYYNVLNFKQSDHTIKIKESDSSFHTWRQYYDVFFDGLRNHKIVTFHRTYDDSDYEIITIRCSKDAKKWITVRD